MTDLAIPETPAMTNEQIVAILQGVADHFGHQVRLPIMHTPAEASLDYEDPATIVGSFVQELLNVSVSSPSPRGTACPWRAAGERSTSRPHDRTLAVDHKSAPVQEACDPFGGLGRRWLGG